MKKKRTRDEDEDEDEDEDDHVQSLAQKGAHMAKEHQERRRRKRPKEASSSKSKVRPNRVPSKEVAGEARPRPAPGMDLADETEIDDQTPISTPSRESARNISKTEQTRKRLSALDLLAIELDVFTRESMAALRRMHAGERVALLSSLCMLGGSFFPWVSTTHQANQLGFFAGGFFHLLIAIVGIRLSFARHGPQAKKKRSQKDLEEKRVALWLVLLGVLSTVAGAALLFAWGASKSIWFRVDFHFALYWTLAWGTGVSYGGYACFRRFK
ncbi:MAG: hypothetical protein GY822_20490 [Deltaproteobacteria bacterium]|nr:hypothetical protein [Deltaproteobacteria bacterium]